MMAKQEPATVTPTTTTACGNCGVQERRLLLHHLRHRGIFRRLCTSCVLKLNPHTFCPTCFLVYDRTPTSTDAVNCIKCYSYTHPDCLIGSGPTKPYTCALCINPNAPVFSLKSAKNEGEGENLREIDRKAARVLLAAARIAEVSMSRAAEGARMEAERRAKEAALTRKRAREALEHVAFLVAKENLKRKEIVSAEVSGSGNVGAMEKNYRGGGGRGGGGGNGFGVPVQNRIGSPLGDAVDLREKERLQGLRAQNPVSGPPNNGVPMGMEESDRQRVSSVSIDHGTVNKNGGSADLGRFEGNNGEAERVISGPFSALPVGDLQTNHGREENVGS